MDLELNDSMTFPAMLKALQDKLPNYKIELKKNPVAKFEYIQVYKSAYVGTWIRVLPQKNRVKLIKTIPNTLARAFFGGLIAIIVASAGQDNLKKEVGEVLKSAFNTKEQG